MQKIAITQPGQYTQQRIKRANGPKKCFLTYNFCSSLPVLLISNTISGKVLIYIEIAMYIEIKKEADEKKENSFLYRDSACGSERAIKPAPNKLVSL